MWNQKWASQNARENTAFTTGEELWRFTVMPFGLPNAPKANSSSFAWIVCLVCLEDDIACMTIAQIVEDLGFSRATKEKE